MMDSHFTTTITVDQSPDEVLKAIGNVHGWWFGDVEGDTAKPGDASPIATKRCMPARRPSRT